MRRSRNSQGQKNYCYLIYWKHSPEIHRVSKYSRDVNLFVHLILNLGRGRCRAQTKMNILQNILGIFGRLWNNLQIAKYSSNILKNIRLCLSPMKVTLPLEFWLLLSTRQKLYLKFQYMKVNCYLNFNNLTCLYSKKFKPYVQLLQKG